MTPCNMMGYPMLEIFGSASPEVITTFYIPRKASQNLYITCIFVFKLFFQGRIGQIPSLLKSGMLISHLRRPPFVYHQASICKPHLTWSFLCPLICTHISLNFIPVTHLFSCSYSFDSPACIVYFAKLTAEKMAFIYITWSFLPLGACRNSIFSCFLPVLAKKSHSRFQI
jgi:hypothetical protein